MCVTRSSEWILLLCFVAFPTLALHRRFFYPFFNCFHELARALPCHRFLVKMRSTANRMRTTRTFKCFGKAVRHASSSNGLSTDAQSSEPTMIRCREEMTAFSYQDRSIPEVTLEAERFGRTRAQRRSEHCEGV